VFARSILLASYLLAGALAFAQPPPVKVNLLNVCSPSGEDQKELSAALATVPNKPVFGSDYEVSRGHSTLDRNTSVPGIEPLPAGAASAANWVRVRREFPASATFSNVQYSFSVDATNMVETLVLRVREPKDLMQVSIEDSASAVTSPAAMLTSPTAVSRVKLERFGKASVVLARCTAEGGNAPPDQSAFETIFHAASSVMNHYRDLLGVRRMVPQELARLGVGGGKRNP
jgi:hypothetical protein